MKKAVSLFSLFAILFTLCACGVGETPPSIPDHASPSFHGGNLGESAQPQTQPGQADSAETASAQTQPFQPAQQFSNDGGTSIDVLREEIAQEGAMFGVAYIGFYSQAEMCYEEWFESSAYDLVGWYPFVGEIDENHTIGTKGHLYCIVGGDYGDSISVMTLDGQMLYAASNGNPILLFCSQNGEGTIADTIVSITTPDGTDYWWEARLDDSNCPELLIGEERQLLSWDFTYAFDMGFELTGWLRDGWLGPTEIGLAGTDVLNPMYWWFIPEEEDGARFCLTFCPNSGPNYHGEVAMDCFYGDDTQVQAHWEGWWRVTTVMEYASWLHMDLMLMDGADQEAFSDSSVISESFMTLLSPSGENLLIVSDSTQTTLPIFPDRWRFCELVLAMG